MGSELDEYGTSDGEVQRIRDELAQAEALLAEMREKGSLLAKWMDKGIDKLGDMPFGVLMEFQEALALTPIAAEKRIAYRIAEAKAEGGEIILDALKERFKDVPSKMGIAFPFLYNTITKRISRLRNSVKDGKKE